MSLSWQNKPLEIWETLGSDSKSILGLCVSVAAEVKRYPVPWTVQCCDVTALCSNHLVILCWQFFVTQRRQLWPMYCVFSFIGHFHIHVLLFFYLRTYVNRKMKAHQGEHRDLTTIIQLIMGSKKDKPYILIALHCSWVNEERREN